MYKILASNMQELKNLAIFKIDKWFSETSLVKNLFILYSWPTIKFAFKLHHRIKYVKLVKSLRK